MAKDATKSEEPKAKPAAADKPVAGSPVPAKEVKGESKPVTSGKGDAKAEATAPAAAAPAVPQTAAEVLGEGEIGKKVVKAKHSKNVVQGIAHIMATFNNTVVSITDPKGG